MYVSDGESGTGSGGPYFEPSGSPRHAKEGCFRCATVRVLRIWLAVIGALALMFLSLLIWHVAKYDSKSASSSPASGYLTNQMHDWILDGMDTNADPCNDFFQYTCGGWLAKNPLPINATSKFVRSFSFAGTQATDQFQAVLDDEFSEAGIFYSQCRTWDADSNATSATRSLASLARWLMVVDELFSVSASGFSTGNAQLWKLLGILSGHQLDVGLGPDSFMLSGSLSSRYQTDKLPDTFHLEVQSEQTIAWSPASGNVALLQVPSGTIATVLDMVEQDLKAAGLPANVFDPAFFNSTTAAHSVIQLVRQFTNWTSPEPTVTLQNFTQLEESGQMASRAFLQGLGNHSIIPAFAHLDDLDSWTGYADHITDIIWLDTSYVNKVLDWVQIASTQCAQGGSSGCSKLASLKATIQTQLLFTLLPTLSDKYSVPFVDSKIPLPWYDGTPSGNRDSFCMQAVQSRFSNILQNEAFVEAFHPDTTVAVNDLVDQIYTELGSTLVYNQWMDQETRTKALNKWTLITKNVMYDSSWNNLLYGLVSSGEWELSYLSAASYQVQRALGTADLPTDTHNPQFVGMTPFTLNAFYLSEANSINMLPGLMLFPLFDVTNPPMLNIAQYGWVAGHELTHGFDNNGRQYDGVGQYVNWWSPSSLSAFNERAQCLIDQYNGYSLTFEGQTFHVDGAKTLGENIADNGGIGIAWRAYRNLYSDPSTTPPSDLLRGHTNDQLFWIMASQVWCAASNAHTMANQIATDVHAPAEVRAFAPFANRVEFAHSFGCNPTDIMGRSLTKDMCQVW